MKHFDAVSKETGTPAISNFDMLGLMWPLHQRPQGLLQNRAAVNATPFSSLSESFQMFQVAQRNLKRLGTSLATMKDAKIPSTLFPAQKDNRSNKLQDASFLCYPVSPPADWWHKMPLTIYPVVRNRNLDLFGARNSFSNAVLVDMHERSSCYKLKHFHAGNLSSAIKTGEDKSPDDDWLENSTLKECQEAICNWMVCLFLLSPLDYSGLVFIRVLIRYNWVSGCSPAVRLKVLNTFFEAVQRANSAELANQRPPIMFEAQEKELCEAMR